MPVKRREPKKYFSVGPASSGVSGHGVLASSEYLPSWAQPRHRPGKRPHGAGWAFDLAEGRGCGRAAEAHATSPGGQVQPRRRRAGTTSSSVGRNTTSSLRGWAHNLTAVKPHDGGSTSGLDGGKRAQPHRRWVGARPSCRGGGRVHGLTALKPRDRGRRG